MSDIQDSGALSRDVRALLNKANIVGNRYLTFAAQKAPESPQASSSPTRMVEEAAVPAAPASHLRRISNTVAEANTGLRLASLRPRLAMAPGAAMAFTSCTGGAGKTTLCATIARALSARSSNVLVADRCPDGIIPFYFSLERQNAGGLQTVYPNPHRPGYPMTLVAAPCDDDQPNVHPHASRAAWLEKLQADASVTLLDLPTLNRRFMPDLMERVGQVVVPLLPDVQSVASIGRAEELAAMLPRGRILFVLNRFDELRPLHRQIRSHFENLLDGRLAPVAIRESEFMAEALSLGMTVLDHAPQSPVAADIEQFVGWVEKRLAGADSAAGTMGIA